MTLAVDTNILRYAVNRGCREYDDAKHFLEHLLGETVAWYLTWGIVYEFLRVSTHTRIFPKPLTAAQSLKFLSELWQSELLMVLTPTDRHEEVLRLTVKETHCPAGNLFHDIQTAVLLREHGVREIVTADTDFLQFRFLQVTNPVH